MMKKGNEESTFIIKSHAITQCGMKLQRPELDPVWVQSYLFFIKIT